MINANMFTPLIVKDNLLDTSTVEYLTYRMENFNSETTPGSVENYYHREYISGEEPLKKMQGFLDSIYSIIKYDYLYPHVKLDGMWINKVDSSSNHNDDFHTDISKFSSITFLNESFDGGNLEYIDIKDNQPLKIKLKPYSTLIFEGSKYPHRVLPVTSGVRYTLVSFWDLPRKESKTLL